MLASAAREGTGALSVCPSIVPPRYSILNAANRAAFKVLLHERRLGRAQRNPTHIMLGFAALYPTYVLRSPRIRCALSTLHFIIFYRLGIYAQQLTVFFIKVV